MVIISVWRNEEPTTTISWILFFCNIAATIILLLLFMMMIPSVVYVDNCKVVKIYSFVPEFDEEYETAKSKWAE